MNKDIQFTVILAAWLLSVAGAFILGIYATYELDRGEYITGQQYREQSLQYLEDIRDILAQ